MGLSMKIPGIEGLRSRLQGEGACAVLVASEDEGVRQGVLQMLQEDLKARGAQRVEILRFEADPPERPFVELANLAAQVPLFGDGYVVVVDRCSPVIAPTELKSFLENPAAHIRLALFLDKKAVDSGLAKLVREAKGVVVAPPDLKEREAVQAAIEEARAKGLRLEPKAAAALIDLVGTDRKEISSAVEALVRYKGEGGLASEEDLLGLVRRTRKEVPWALDDAVVTKDLLRGVKIVLRRLQAEGKPLPLLYALARIARRILQAKALVSQGLSDIEAQQAMRLGWAFQWERLREGQAGFDARGLEAFLKDVPRLEILLKRDYAPGEAVVLLAALNVFVLSAENRAKSRQNKPGG